MYVVSIFGCRKEGTRRVAILQVASLITSNLPGAHIEKQNGVCGSRLIVGTTNSICFALLALTLFTISIICFRFISLRYDCCATARRSLIVLCHDWSCLRIAWLIIKQSHLLQNYCQALWTSDLVKSKALISRWYKLRKIWHQWLSLVISHWFSWSWLACNSLWPIIVSHPY